MPGVYKDYSIVNASNGLSGFSNPGPCILFDNLKGNGYKPRSACSGYRPDTCCGFVGNISLMILGQGVTENLLKYSAGFPVRFLGNGQNGGCSYNPQESFVYNQSANATLSFSGRCDSCGLYGFEWFEYNSTTETYIPKGVIRAASACAGGCGVGSPSGSTVLTAADISPILSGADNKNIIVAIIDSNIGSPGSCGVGGGCNTINLTLSYNGKSGQFSAKASGCGTTANEGKCKWWKKLPKTDCIASSGNGELNPFPCDSCRRRIEELSSLGIYNVDSYETCMSSSSQLSGFCNSQCCKFFFPCSADEVEDSAGGSDSCNRAPRYDEEGNRLPDIPCIDSSITSLKSRVQSCQNYTVDTVKYCEIKNCCTNPCEAFNIPRADEDPFPQTGNWSTPDIGDILTWDLCPGNHSFQSASNTSYSYIRTDKSSTFINFNNTGCNCEGENWCGCGSMQPNVSTLCRTNPKTGEVILPTNSEGLCSLRTLKISDLFNNTDCDPRNVNSDGELLSCSLMTCDAIRSLGTVTINGIQTDLSQYDCFWTPDTATLLGLNLNNLVFQTCIDKLGASFYKCKFYTCENMSPTTCGSVPNCQCCQCTTTEPPPGTTYYLNSSSCQANCPRQSPGGCTVCP